MCQNDIMKVLKKDPNKYFSSLRLAKKLGINQQSTSRAMTRLIKSRFVIQKFIYNERKGNCIRLIKIKL